MRRLLLLAICFLLVLPSIAMQTKLPLMGVGGGAAAAGNGYLWKRTITIDRTKVPNTDQANYPMLLTGTFTDMKTVANGGVIQNTTTCCGTTLTVPADLIFTSDSAGTALLNWDWEAYDAATGAIVVWINVGTATTASDKVIYVFYDKAAVTTYQATATSTWESSYKIVYHLNENAAATTIHDSGATAFSATATANTSGKTQTSCAFTGARCLNFAGTDLITVVSGATTLSGSWTVDFWGYVNGGAGSVAYVGSRASSENSFDAQAPSAGTTVHGDIGTGSAWLSTAADGTMTRNDNTWYHLVWVVTATTYTVYGNGSNIGSGSWSSNTPLLYNATHTLVWGGSSTASPSLAGRLDEARISSTNRSGDYIATEYNNISSSSTFSTVGSATAN